MTGFVIACLFVLLCIWTVRFVVALVRGICSGIFWVIVEAASEIVSARAAQKTEVRRQAARASNVVPFRSKR